MTIVSLGIDIGGTKTAFGLVDPQGKAVRRSRVPTEPNQPLERLVDVIGAEVDRWKAESDKWTIAGVGIGCAGPVDSEKGTIENQDSLPHWMGAPVVALLTSRLGIGNAVLDNDANAAALGEARFGDSEPAGSLMMLTFGTGVGGGFIAAGTPYRGVDGAHPEFGMTPVAVESPAGVQVNSLEEFASGEGIRRRAADRGLLVPSAGDIFSMADAGHAVALEIIGWAMQATAWGAWTLAHTYLPEVIAVGGGVAAKQSNRYLGAIRDGLNRARLVPNERIQVRLATASEDAGMIGAAALAMQ